MTLNVPSIFPVLDAQTEYFQSQLDQGIRAKLVVKSADETYSNGSFGYFNVGAGSRIIQNITYGTYFVTPLNGSIHTIAFHGQAGTTNNKQCAIYQYAPGSALLGVTGSINENAYNGWRSFNFPGSIYLPAGSYILCVCGDLTSIMVHYDSGTALNAQGRSGSMADTFPITNTSWTGGAGNFNQNYLLDIYTIIDTGINMGDSQLFFPLEAKSLYNYQFIVGASAQDTTPDIKFTVSGPIGASGMFYTTTPLPLGSYEPQELTTTPTWFTYNGYINTDNTAGNVRLIWQQNTPGSSTTTVKQGSWGTLAKQ